MTTDKPNCYECKWRRCVPGDAHSRCANPGIKLTGVGKIMAEMYGGKDEYDPNAQPVKVTGNEHGIRMGWFFWPVNFDPTWLVSCDGFALKEKS